LSFQPILPMTGYTGWMFLKRTLDMQQASHAQSAGTPNVTKHFRNRIVSVETVDDLVSDRRLLQVALGAFGLEADINSRAFIRRILEDGTNAPDALSNRLADKRYRRFAAAFANPEGGLRTDRTGQFAQSILDRFHTKSFQSAVGAVDDSMRLALNLAGALADLRRDSATNDARWFGILGQPPLRRVFETALGLPRSFATADIDTQHDAFKTRARAVFGTDDLELINSSDMQEKLLRLYFARENAVTNMMTSSAVALTLLQSAPRF
jgi:hypothetical protein